MKPCRISLIFVMVLSFVLAGVAQDTSGERNVRGDEHLKFLQKNFTNFGSVTLLAPNKDSQTVIQSFRVKDRVVGTFNGQTYVGVRFTVPEWLNGNLVWTFFHLNPANKKRERVDVGWGIIPEQGNGFPQNVKRSDPDGGAFWKRFPNTRRAYTHTVNRTNLQAGASYALYFTHYEAVSPDVAFGITVDSERGRQEFGSLDYITGRTAMSAAAEAEAITAYIQDNWTNFATIKFIPTTNRNDAVFQDFMPNENVVGWFLGRFYCGVQFTVPEWMDGDLEMAFVHRYRSERALRSRPGYGWGITAQKGEFYGMGNVDRVPFENLPEAKARYPFTEKGYVGRANKRFFVPGQTYVYWWSYWWNGTDGVAPDMDVALTIVSERGSKEFGKIVWR